MLWPTVPGPLLMWDSPDPPRMSRSGLKPCPWCGGVDLLTYAPKAGAIIFIECVSCKATGPIGLGDPDRTMEKHEAEDLIRNLWDTREGMS